MTDDIFRIKSTSNVQKTALAMYYAVKKNPNIVFSAVGAGAVNQMFKITVHASGIFAREGKALFIKPGMQNVPGKVGDESREISIATITVHLR